MDLQPVLIVSHDSEENGMAKWFNGNIMNAVQATLSTARISWQYWTWALEDTTDKYNPVPHKDTRSSPHQACVKILNTCEETIRTMCTIFHGARPNSGLLRQILGRPVWRRKSRGAGNEKWMWKRYTWKKHHTENSNGRSEWLSIPAAHSTHNQNHNP